jgi:hypothetical protein
VLETCEIEEQGNWSRWLPVASMLAQNASGGCDPKPVNEMKLPVWRGFPNPSTDR